MHQDILDILKAAKTGDSLAVYSKTFFGFWIRRMLSLGLHKCYTNHNAPVYCLAGRLMMLQIEAPKAHEEYLIDYLTDLYNKGGQAILLRPDVYDEQGVSEESSAYLKYCWQAMRGKEYDNPSIKQILRMVLRYAPHADENTKDRIYCTEGTVTPILDNTLQPWKPDILRNEPFPAPIHFEHLVRQGRLVFKAGNKKLYEQIKNG
jgi:hypothetical protein